MKRRLLMLLTSITLILSMCTVSMAAAALPGEGQKLDNTIVILHTNDSHGRVVRDDNNGQAGFTTVSAVKQAYEAAGATVLLLDAGDTLHGLPIATLNSGSDVVSVMNAVGYDAMTPGNHDFNYGTDRLLALSKTMKFPLLSANTVTAASGTAILPATTVVQKNNIRFGIFGLTTPETAYKTNPEHVKGITFANPITHAVSAVEELKKQNVDYIIALAHIGVDASSEYTSDMIAAEVPGIDIIIDGHSHTAMVNGEPVDKSIKLVPHGDTLIASTGEYIYNIGVVTISADKTKKADLLAYNKELPTDAKIDSLIADVEKKLDTVLSEVVGKTSVRLVGERESARKEEVNLGNLAADAIRSASGADIAFTNGGGIRASIEAGDITKRDLVTVFPFGNYVVTKKVTGQAILEVLEHGVKDYPELSGGFPQVSGVSFQFDPSKKAGSRVSNVLIGGKALDKKAEYLLATNDFLAAGGDDYTMLGTFPIANEYGALEEILTDYIKKNPSIEAKVEGRITVKAASTAPEETGSQTKPEPVPDKNEEPQPPVKPTDNAAVKYYVVKSGDNLWKISAKVSGDGTKWKAIYKLNQDIISNPNKIQVGQKLKIPA